jgi:hypothetical protein
MEYTYKDLKKKTVADLKEIAKGIEHEAVKGYTQLNKDHLLKAICTALNIDTFEHQQVEGIDKSTIKKRIRELKKDRLKALESKDSAKLKAVRTQIKGLKKQLRKAMVKA